MTAKIKKCFVQAKTIIYDSRYTLYLAIPFLLMDLLLRTIVCDIDFFPAYYPTPTIFSISWIVLFVGLVASVKGIWGKILYWIFFAAGFTLFLTNGIYFSLTSFCFSFTLLEMSGECSDYIMDAILGAGFKVYIPVVLVIAVAVLVFRKMPKVEKCNGKRVLKVIAAFIIIHTFAFLTLGPKNSELKWNTFKNPRNIYDDFSDSNKCMKVTGLYEYSIRNIYVTFFKA